MNDTTATTTGADYNTLSVVELRTMARAQFGGQTAIACASKGALVQWLTSGTFAAPAPAAPASDLASVLQAAMAAAVASQPAALDVDTISEMIRAALDARPATMDNAAVDARINAAVANIPPRVIVLQSANGNYAITGRVHFKTELLAHCVAAGVNVMLCGPAGTGKTTAAHKIATGLGLDFVPFSVGPQTTKSDLLGYMDANGKYVASAFRRAFEFGALFLLDEFDAANAATVTILNAALANGVCSFPDGTIERHPRFVCVAAANTYGRGADRQYVGRQQLDAATLDRFACIAWCIDAALEASFVGLDVAAPDFDIRAGGLVSGPAEWLRIVQAARLNCERHGIRHCVSPRATINGAKLCATIGRTHLVEMLITKGLDAETSAKILDGAI